MKKISIIALAAVAALAMFAIAGCSKAEFFENSIDLIVDGNPSTGYEWVADASYDADVIEVADPVISQDEGEGAQLSGAPAQYSFMVTSKAPGDTVLTLNYQRSWEGEPIETKAYDVHVDDEGGIFVELQGADE